MNKHIEKKLDEIDALQEELRNVPEGESGYTRRIEIYQRITELMKEVRTDVSYIYQRGREDEREELKETNLVELTKKMEEELQEHADMHGEFCPCNAEDPDACDCEEMKFWTKTIKDWMGKVNQMWVGHLQEHRRHCTPEGRKDLTRIKRIISPL